MKSVIDEHLPGPCSKCHIIPGACLKMCSLVWQFHHQPPANPQRCKTNANWLYKNVLGCLVRVCSRYFLICTILDLGSLGVVLKQLLFSLLHPWFTNWGLGTSKNKHHWLWPVDPKDASKCCGIRAISWLSQTSGVTYPSFWLSPCDQGVHKLCKLSYCPCKRF